MHLDVMFPTQRLKIIQIVIRSISRSSMSIFVVHNELFKIAAFAKLTLESISLQSQRPVRAKMTFLAYAAHKLRSHVTLIPATLALSHLLLVEASVDGLITFTTPATGHVRRIDTTAYHTTVMVS